MQGGLIGTLPRVRRTAAASRWKVWAVRSMLPGGLAVQEFVSRVEDLGFRWNTESASVMHSLLRTRWESDETFRAIIRDAKVSNDSHLIEASIREWTIRSDIPWTIRLDNRRQAQSIQLLHFERSSEAKPSVYGCIRLKEDGRIVGENRYVV